MPHFYHTLTHRLAGAVGPKLQKNGFFTALSLPQKIYFYILSKTLFSLKLSILSMINNEDEDGYDIKSDWAGPH